MMNMTAVPAKMRGSALNLHSIQDGTSPDDSTSQVQVEGQLVVEMTGPRSPMSATQAAICLSGTKIMATADINPLVYSTQAIGCRPKQAVGTSLHVTAIRWRPVPQACWLFRI